MMIRMALDLLIIIVPLQMFLGDQHGLNTLEYQPAKLAAIEGHWETGSRVPLILFGWPDDAAETTRYALEVPYLGSLILTHSLDGTIRGLKEWKPEDRPPSVIVFWSFRIMVGIGFLMLLVVVLGNWLRWRGRLFETRWFLLLCQLCLPVGFIAVITGWVTTEVGRQPWLVYGLVRTAEGMTPSLTGHQVLVSLLLYIAVYLVVYPLSLYYAVTIVHAGPGAAEEARPIEGLQRPLPAQAAAGVTLSPEGPS
jgi:cytochrome bd ubiquinol oxidase subunit I